MQTESLSALQKLQWAAKMLCLVAGAAMLLGFLMISANAGLYGTYPGQWWVLFVISIIYPTAAIAAWRFQTVGGIIVILIATAMVIYSTLAIVSGVWYDYEPVFYNSDFWWVFVNLALDISIVFMISGLLHAVSGHLQKKRS